MAKKAEEKKVVATPKKEAKKAVVAKKVAVKDTPKKVTAKKTVVKKTEVKKEVTKKVTKKVEVKEVLVEKAVEKIEEASKTGYKGKVTVEQLFEAGAHFGHVVKKWNPKMAKYLWGEKNGIHIFDLEKTLNNLNEACTALEKAAATGKRIVIVGTKRQARSMVEEMAKRVNVPHITQRWLGGLITNWKQVRQTIDRLVTLRLKREQGQLKKFTKKEQVLFDKEISKLERVVGGLVGLKDVPEVVVVIDTHKERLAVKEASSRGVTVIGLADSNSNPDMVNYPIPMNDDATKALEIVIAEFEAALMAGQKEMKK